jgi:predicted O-methyltransferase YrrM
MNHFYKKIQNWFDYEDVFDLALSRAKNGDRFVEIGVWKGGSTAYMGVEILNSRKKILYDAIDTFSGSSEHGDVSNWLYEETVKNLRPIIKVKIVNIIKGHSLDVVNRYDNESIDFCFIDGSHEYEYVKADILAYLPKIKKGGIIAGHDYNNEDWGGVVRAVDEIFGDNKKIIKTSWVHFNN